MDGERRGVAVGDRDRIGRYEPIRHLATGGMAEIYVARQHGLDAPEPHVVLKTILREHSTSAKFVAMFLDEARLAAMLSHQNIARVYEVDEVDGVYFMAMELIHGENARAICERARRLGEHIPLDLAVMIVARAAAGLHHAHEQRGTTGAPLNIVHRDVSPANIMIGYDGSVKVLDFGIAKAEERLAESASGTIKGKYGYMSPEQCRGKLIDRRSDVFSLGIVLYELTTLRKAFKGATDFQTMQRIVAGELERPGAVIPGYPPELEAIVHRALAVDPGSRFPTAQAFASALGEFAAHAKLSPSTTTLASYLVRLFGNKKEPWLEPPEAPVRPVEVVVVEPPPDIMEVGPESTDVGARPLIEDPKLGWETSISHRPLGRGAGTRLETDEPVDRNSDRVDRPTMRRWLLAPVLLAAIVALALILTR